MKYKMALEITLPIILIIFCAYIIHTNNHPATRAIFADGIDTDNDIVDADKNYDNQQLYAAAVALAASSQKITYQITSSTPQFVILSFDGSKSVSTLDDTLAFEEKMRAENKPLHFTYFINAAYFLTQDKSQLYKSPREKAGVANIEFSTSTQCVADRVKEFNKALAEGNEIGSHTAGHFNGSTWSYSEWKQEFDSFTSIMEHVQQNNYPQQIDTPAFLSNIRGFRAPELGVNENLYKVLKDLAFKYDASGIGADNKWPYKDEYGIWHIPLGIVFVGTNTKPVVSTDYNIWARESNEKDIAMRGTPLWDKYFNETKTAYKNYFNSNYNGNRAPVLIANHFSKLNDGVYWEAMKAFAEEVCGLPQVRCATYGELVDYLNTSGAPQLAKR